MRHDLSVLIVFFVATLTGATLFGINALKPSCQEFVRTAQKLSFKSAPKLRDLSSLRVIVALANVRFMFKDFPRSSFSHVLLNRSLLNLRWPYFCPALPPAA